MNTGTLLILGVLALISLAGIMIVLIRSGSRGDEVGERILTYATVPEFLQERKKAGANPRLFRIRRRINSMLSVLGTEDLNLQLMRADWKITSTEYILIRIGVMFVGFVFGWIIFGSILSGLALAILANLLPGIFLRRSATQQTSRRPMKWRKRGVAVWQRNEFRT